MTQQEMDVASSGASAIFFVYANIEFTDLRTGVPHYAHFCWRYIGNVSTIAKGFYGCSEYNETGDVLGKK
jgi:hypothetical protein